MTILRLVWRHIAPPPPLPDGFPAWEKWASRTVQYLLYAALIAQPAIGMMMGWTEDHQVSYFGLFTLPALLPVDEPWNKFFDSAHGIVGWGLICLATLHALAALRHHFLLHNDILRRMLPGTG